MKKLLVLFILSIYVFPAYSAVDNSLVKKAETYLNDVTGLTGDFAQISGKDKDSGKFYMLRPGKVRLDYKNNPVQLIADGSDLYFFDKSIDQITTVPLTSTPAGILIRKKINLQTADIKVSETRQDKNTFTLKMYLKDNEGFGNMIVTFDNAPVKLHSWVVEDATGVKTQVAFSNLNIKTDFEKNYFQIQRHKTISNASGDSFYE